MTYTENEKKVKKSGAVKKNDFKFSIRDVPFSRKLSFLAFYEGIAPTETGAERKQLLLSRTLRKYELQEGPPPGIPHQLALRPTRNGASLPYVAVATPSMLELDTEYGFVQICFDSKDLLRIRGCGIGLRLFAAMEPHEAFIPRLDGTWQMSRNVVGEFLFAPIAGNLDVDTEWDWKRIASDDTVIDTIPDSSGAFEFAIRFAESGSEANPPYRPFEACVADAQDDYEKWLEMYPRVPGRYEDTKKLAAYSVWICYVAPMGLLKSNIVLFSKDNSAFSWHQAYHAMSIANDIDVAVQIMCSMFDYQDEYGEIPDLIDDQYVNILATKPPFHGFALLYMLERMGDKMTSEHCEMLYGPLSKWYQWWMTLRDTDHDGVPQYNQGCESGIDFTLMLSKGTPAECPDLMAYLILLAEGLGKLAERLGKAGEAEEWLARSKKMLDVLIRDFWDGRKFVARLSSSHEIIDFDEIEAYVPMMLGKRLPQEILVQMAKDLSDPKKFYTPIGFRSAPRQYLDGRPVPAFVGGFAQIKLIPGLYEAGYRELARDALIGFCDKNLKELPNFGYLEFDPLETPGAPGAGGGIDIRRFGLCSALASAIFIAMAGYLAEISV